MRKPETPSCSQKPMIRINSSLTAGLCVFEVRLEVVEAVEVVLAAPRGRSVHVAFCTPGNTIPLFQLRGRVFDQT